LAVQRKQTTCKQEAPFTLQYLLLFNLILISFKDWDICVHVSGFFLSELAKLGCRKCQSCKKHDQHTIKYVSDPVVKKSLLKLCMIKLISLTMRC